MGLDARKPNLDSIASIAKSITSNLDLSAILSALSEEISRHFCAESWCVLRLDRTAQELFFVVAEGPNADKIQHQRMPANSGIAGWVVEHREPLIVRDVQKDGRFHQKMDELSGFKTSSIVAVPILYHADILGVIELVNLPNIENFSEVDLNLLVTIADFSAIAMANSSLYAHLKFVASTDALTGLYNRNKLTGVLSEWEVEHSHRHRNSPKSEWFLSVFAVDLNRFKYVNDNFGHREGDRILQETAAILSEGVRSKDLVFRTGGDEFLVFLTYLQGDVQVAKIEEARFRDYLKQKMSRLSHGCSFSIGSACGPFHQANQLIHEADLQMYQDKTQDKVQSK